MKEPLLSHLDKAGRARMGGCDRQDADYAYGARRGRGHPGPRPCRALAAPRERCSKGNVLETGTPGRHSGRQADREPHPPVPFFAPRRCRGPRGPSSAIACSSRPWRAPRAATGVEMEALTAASVAALTVYDMCKAASKNIVIGPIRLLEKFGGRSGHLLRKGSESCPEGLKRSASASAGACPRPRCPPRGCARITASRATRTVVPDIVRSASSAMTISSPSSKPVASICRQAPLPRT